MKYLFLPLLFIYSNQAFAKACADYQQVDKPSEAYIKEVERVCAEERDEAQAEMTALRALESLSMSALKGEPMKGNNIIILRTQDAQVQILDLISEIAKNKSSFESQAAIFGKWSAQAADIQREVTFLNLDTNKAKALPSDHPAYKIINIRDNSEYAEHRKMAKKIIERLPKEIFSQSPNGDRLAKLNKSYANLNGALKLARQRLDNKGNEFYEQHAQLDSPEVIAVKTKTTYTKFRDLSELSELTRSYTLLLAQGLYLTVGDDSKNQRIRLKSVEKQLGANAQYVADELQYDRNILDKVDKALAGMNPDTSFLALTGALKATQNVLAKRTEPALSKINDRITEWQQESARYGKKQIIQLKGELLYREARTALHLIKPKKASL